MRLIHCADIHLDSKMTSNLTKEKARERKAELLNTFGEMIRYGEKNHVAGIIIAGDLFDTKNISAAARNVFLDAVKNHPDIVFYYLKGNHDADLLLNNLEAVPENLKLFGDRWTTYSASDNVVITGVEFDGTNGTSIYNELSLDREKFNIVMLHGQETQSASRDTTEVIQLKKLKGAGIDYLALGHVHAYKMAALDNHGYYCYPGCLEGRGFDECGEHGFVILDIDEERGIFSTEFVRLACRNLYTLETDITGCRTTEEIAGRLEEDLKDADYSPRSLVKLVLTGSVDVECDKNMDLLLKRFENRYYFLKIYDETKLMVDYSAFALDESLKGEFVRKVWAAENLNEEEKTAVIRYGIQALAGEEV